MRGHGFMKVTTIFLSLIIFLIFHFHAFSEEFFVDPVNGSDTGGTGDSSNPWQTITYTLKQVESSFESPYTIHAANGIYSIESGENFPLNIINDVHLIGTDPENTIIDASLTAQSVINCVNTANIVIKNLMLTGGSGTVTFDS